jgi:hypothetical protein
MKTNWPNGNINPTLDIMYGRRNFPNWRRGSATMMLIKHQKKRGIFYFTKPLFSSKINQEWKIKRVLFCLIQ